MFTIKLMVGRQRVLIVVLGGTALKSWYIARTGVYSADIARSDSNCLAWRIPSSEKIGQRLAVHSLFHSNER